MHTCHHFAMTDEDTGIYKLTADFHLPFRYFTSKNKGCGYIYTDNDLLVALRATKLLFTPTQSRDYILITTQYR